ncbi:MAG: hypothetical protein KIT69_11720 [Propionibacteriaceae bacterium]|nr:hypothetical protein [Propionibacteriaceae bacterium]
MSSFKEPVTRQPFRRPDYVEYMDDPKFGNIPKKYQGNYDRVSSGSYNRQNVIDNKLRGNIYKNYIANAGENNQSRYRDGVNDSNVRIPGMNYFTKEGMQMQKPRRFSSREKMENSPPESNAVDDSTLTTFKHEIYTPNDIRRSKYNMPYGYDFMNNYLDSRLFTDANMGGYGNNYNSIGKSYNWYGDVTYNPEVHTMTPERCEARNMICATLPEDDQWGCKNFVRRTGCDYYIPGSVPVPSVGKWGGIHYSQEAANKHRPQYWSLENVPRIVNGIPTTLIDRPASLHEPERYVVIGQNAIISGQMSRQNQPKITKKCNGTTQDCIRPKKNR